MLISVMKRAISRYKWPKTRLLESKRWLNLFKIKSDCLNRSESQFKGLERTLKFFFSKNKKKKKKILSYRQVPPIATNWRHMAPSYNLRYSTVVIINHNKSNSCFMELRWKLGTFNFE